MPGTTGQLRRSWCVSVAIGFGALVLRPILFAIVVTSLGCLGVSRQDGTTNHGTRHGYGIGETGKFAETNYSLFGNWNAAHLGKPGAKIYCRNVGAQCQRQSNKLGRTFPAKEQSTDSSGRNGPNQVAAALKVAGAKLCSLGQRKLHMASRRERLAKQMEALQEESKLDDELQVAQQSLENITTAYANQVVRGISGR